MTSQQPARGWMTNLSTCDTEPLHVPGSIQPVGFLISLTADWRFQQVSLNIGDYVGRAPEDLIGQQLETLFTDSIIHAMRGRIQVLASADSRERIFAADIFGDGRLFDLSLHVSGPSIVLEAEPAAPPAGNPSAFIQGMITRVHRTETMDALYRESVRQLRAVTGFDRVMLYRFASDLSGHVIAESARTGIGSFLDLHYPAGDIPANARALYLRTPVRIIADIDAPSVPIIPALTALGEPLDLSLAASRAVAPVHLEYLRNMGVCASMSISIIIDGRLWGLFALHHYQPRVLGMEMRAAIELFAQMVSLTIEGRLNRERRLAEEAARCLHDRFLTRIAAEMPTIDAIANCADELRAIIPADGLAIWAKGQIRQFGRCPSPEETRELGRFLANHADNRIFSTDRLDDAIARAGGYSNQVAGVLAIPISRKPRDYLLFFRRELVQTVNWAGDPANKERTVGPLGVRLTPRKSFEAWKETVHGSSEGWTEENRRAAEALRISILDILLRIHEENERQQGLAAQRQELLIAELNHRVRNILSLIRAIVVRSRPGVSDVDAFARIISGRLQALARAHDQITNDTTEPVLLAGIIHTEVAAYLGDKAIRVAVTGPAIAVNAQAYSTLALVFHELVTNSAKYGALSVMEGHITVATSLQPDGSCAVEWRESNGPVVSPPTRRGFGATIIERSIPHDLGGEARLDYAPDGFVAHFVLPPQSFQAHSGMRAGASPRPEPIETQLSGEGRTQVLKGLRALIVEDNLLLSLDAEHFMLNEGMEHVFAAANVSDARRVLDTQKIDIVLLDVNLGLETSFPLVAPLNELNIPYIFLTGYGEALEMPAEGSAKAVIRKPFASNVLLKTICDVLGRTYDGDPK